jgi:hypothetical protein
VEAVPIEGESGGERECGFNLKYTQCSLASPTRIFMVGAEDSPCDVFCRRVIRGCDSIWSHCHCHAANDPRLANVSVIPMKDIQVVELPDSADILGHGSHANVYLCKYKGKQYALKVCKYEY